MDYPPDRVMECLGALAYANKVEDKDDTLVATYNEDGRTVVVGVDEMTTLTARGWLDMDVDEEATVTAAGVYWYGRWLKLKQPKRIHLYGPLVLKRSALKLKRGVGGNPTVASGGMARGAGRGNGNHPYGKTEA